MPGINTTGAPNTRDYVLGRGVVYFATINVATGLPDANGFRDLGNSPEFTITMTTEDLKHQNSRDCTKFTDKRFVLSQEVGLTVQLDETRNFQNLAMFFAGSTLTYANPNATFVDTEVTADVIKGNWYQLRNAAGLRIYGLDNAGLVYTLEKQGAPDTALVEGTDYEIDEQLGLVRFLPAGVVLADGDAVDFSISAAATTPLDVDEMAAVQSATVEGALLFVQDNAGDCGQKVEWQFHLVSLSADGDLGMIGDEVATMSLTGIAQANTLVADTSKVLTVRTYEMQS